jgi:hypothetical protein
MRGFWFLGTKLIGRQRGAGPTLAAAGLDVGCPQPSDAEHAGERLQISCMNAGVGGGWLSSGVPEIGTNGTTNG